MEIIKSPRHFTIEIQTPDGIRSARCYYIAELPIGRAFKFFGLQKEYNATAGDEVKQAALMLDMFDVILDGLTREEFGELVPYQDAMKILEEATGDLKKNIETSPMQTLSSLESSGIV